MKWVLRGIAALVGFTALAFAIAWVTMLLWNGLIPRLFNGPEITYLQAAGLMILGRLLVGGFGGKRHCGCHGGRWGHHRHGYWKKRWEDKMASMTPEEREKFEKGMNKCGWGGRGWYGRGWDDCEKEAEPKNESNG